MAVKKIAGKLFKQFHKDGSLWATGKMLNGKMEGFWKWFRTDGSKLRSGYFKGERQVGEWTTYDEKNKVVKVTDFGK